MKTYIRALSYHTVANDGYIRETIESGMEDLATRVSKQPLLLQLRKLNLAHYLQWQIAQYGCTCVSAAVTCLVAYTVKVWYMVLVLKFLFHFFLKKKKRKRK